MIGGINTELARDQRDEYRNSTSSAE